MSIIKKNWCINEYINISEVNKLKENVLKVKVKRQQQGKDIDFSIMTHIASCIGGKMIKKGLITEKELINVIHFDTEYLEV